MDGTDIYPDDDTARRKFQTAYLQGWALLHAMGWSATDYDDSADDEHCGNGSGAVLVLETLEHAPAGFLEGFAHWYSATAFNREDEADCSYVYWRPSNWDRLDTCFADREALSGHVLSCATGPDLPPFEGLVPETDYRGYCALRAPGATLPSGTVVPLDVVRFLWDRVLNDTGYSMLDVGQTYEDQFQSLPSSNWRLDFTNVAAALGANATAWGDAAEAHGLDQ